MSCYTYVVLVTILLSVSADLTSLDCPLRQIGLDYAASLQPFRSLASLQEIADALNGAVEAANCSVKPKQRSGHSSSRVGWADLPSVQSGVNTIWCDPNASNDGDGSKGYPYLTIQRALEDVKEIRGKLKVAPSQSPFAIVLRSGVFYLDATINMDSSLGFVSFQSAPGEHAAISGAVPILDVKWLPFAPPPRDAYETKQGCLSQQFDAPVTGGGIIFSAHVAAGMCDKTTVCAGFIINAQTRMVYFKTEVFWQPRSTRGKACAAGPAAEDLGTVYIKNYGYTAVAKGSPNLFVADLSGLGITADITGLRIAGQRQIRARYPNARTVEQINSMQVIADEWTSPPTDHGAASYYNPSYPARMDSVFDTRVKAPFFSTFKLGIGGPCAERFTPQASYWCSNASEGGGPGQYEAPVGFSVSNANESLPHLGTYEDTDAVKGAIVHTWRRGRWYSWAFEVDEFSYDASNSTATFGFSLERGGNQGSRGGTAGQEFMIENVLDELDSPGEFFFDSSAQKLYVWHNVTTSTPTPPPNAGEVTATQLRVLFNISGASQSDPVKNVSFTGIVFKDTALTYMDPHGTPSGGDWAVTRAAALYFENTENTLLSKSLLSTLDGHAVFLSGYNRGAVIDQNEFVGIGETAISQWGYTDGSPVPGMGWDARSGNQPRGTRVTYNLVHEVGVWAKQNSFYFQSESFMNHIEGNIAYNGPRAGINFDDGMGGGSNVTRNVLFNFCRESADHGPFNSWDRVVYVYDGDDGNNGTVIKKNDTISFNWILANYHSSEAVDNDDGSCFYDTHDNVFIHEMLDGRAFGSLKSDFGGHSNYHHNNLDLFFADGFSLQDEKPHAQLPGFEDGYYENYLYMTTDGEYGFGNATVYSNTIWSPTGNVTEGGKPLAEFQKEDPKHNDPRTVASAYPDDKVVLDLARKILGMA